MSKSKTTQWKLRSDQGLYLVISGYCLIDLKEFWRKGFQNSGFKLNYCLL